MSNEYAIVCDKDVQDNNNIGYQQENLGMDMTITSHQSHKWELLGKLALFGQDNIVHLDEHLLTQQIVEILQQYDVASWGLLVLFHDGTVQTQSNWGISDDLVNAEAHEIEQRYGNNSQQGERLSLSIENQEIGYLLLAKPQNEDDETFYRTIAAQLGIVLSLKRYHGNHSGANGHDSFSDTTLQRETVTLIEQQQQLDLLHNIASVSASTNATTVEEHTNVYQTIVEALATINKSDDSYLVIYDRKKGTARIAASSTRTEEIAATSSFALFNNQAVVWLDQHQAPLVVSDAMQNPLLESFHDLFRMHGIVSTILLPLIVGDQVYGCVQLNYTTPLKPLSERGMRLCETILCQAAKAVESTILFTKVQTNAQALEHKVGELSTLLEAARLLGSVLQPDEVLNNLMDLVSRQLGVTTVALWTLSNDKTNLRPAAMDGISNEMAGEMNVPVGQGLTGKVAATGIPLIVTDVFEEGGSLYPSFNRSNQLVSFMGVPIFYRERIIGVLSVMTSQRYEFSNDEMMLLSGLAGQAAIALENARLFQEREQRIHELATINQISTAVNASLKLDDILSTLHWGISEILDTQYSYVAIYNVATTSQSAILRQHIVRNNNNVQISNATIPLDGKGLIDYVVLDGKPLLVQTADERLTFLAKRAETQTGNLIPQRKKDLLEEPASWLGVPIMVGDDILGAIVLQSPTPYAYSNDDTRFLSTVASQVAVAISNARLFSERERRLREITVLKDIGSAISVTLDMEGILERLYHEMGQAIDMTTSLIGIYHEQTNILSYPICYDRGNQLHFNPEPLPEGSNAWAIRNRQPLLIHTVEQSKQMGLNDFGNWLFDVRLPHSGTRHPQSREVQSAIVTPIISGSSVVGVINIKSYKPYAFDEDDLRFVMTVASQLAITISNMHMFMERERRIKELATFNEIGQALSSTVSIDNLPNLIYNQTSRLLDTTNFYMALFDQNSNTIHFPIFYERGIKHTIAATTTSLYDMPAALSINPGLYRFVLYLIQRVIDKRETLLLKGSDLDHVDLGNIDELREEMSGISSSFHKPRAWIGVPMIVSDKVVGVIGIQNYDYAHAYGTYDSHLLSTIASWAAIALENARLFEEKITLAARLEQRVAERTAELRQANIELLKEKDYLETIHAITLELTATLDLDKIINRALEVASKNLGVSRGSIMLRELQNGQLVCRAVLQEQGLVQSAEVPISFGNSEGLAGWVMRNQTPVYIPDVHNDKRWIVEPGRAEEIRSVAAAPLMTGDTTLGVLFLSTSTVNYFNDSQLRLLATIANEVAIAINNAQLYNYLNEMATRLADLLEQQKEENTRSHAILQSLTEGVIVLDEDQHISLMNRAAEYMLNISANDVLEQKYQTLKTYGNTEEQRDRAFILYDTLEKGLEKVKEQNNIYSMSIELPSPRQNIAINVATVATADSHYYGNVAVLRDVTREIESDRAKREFIANVSHELRTPLTVIKGYIDMLLIQSMGELNENQVNFLNITKTNSNRLMDLINDILLISRIESGKIKLQFAEVDMAKVIQDVVESLKIEAQNKMLDVSLDIAENLPKLKADEKRLTQILFNLLSNAVKYTYDEGYITIRAYLNPAQMIQVDIEDNGVGMTPEQCEKLFQPFYRADSPLRETAGGTGLGLSITKSMVEQHNGELWVKSKQNKGSTFSFILPLEQPNVPYDDDDGDDE